MVWAAAGGEGAVAGDVGGGGAFTEGSPIVGGRRAFTGGGAAVEGGGVFTGGGPVIRGRGACLTGEVGVVLRAGPEGGGATFCGECLGDVFGYKSALMTELLALFLISTSSE